MTEMEKQHYYLKVTHHLHSRLPMGANTHTGHWPRWFHQTAPMVLSV